MDFLVHASTFGHLLVAGSLEILAVATQNIDVHVIMLTPTPHLLLWAMTTFVRVFKTTILQMETFASIRMLHSGMAKFVRVVGYAVI